jgi:hypothetical protein
MFKSILTAIALTITSATVASAAVLWDDATKTMTITGQTTMYQASQVYRVNKANEVLNVVMYGQGGSYYAGLRIGGLIKAEGSNVIIPMGKQCVSACAFAALAGNKVIVDGELWFHAPYLTEVPTGATILGITQNFGVAYNDMSKYLLQMGVTIDFASELLKITTPSKFIIINDSSELRKLYNTDTPWSRAYYVYTTFDSSTGGTR